MLITISQSKVTAFRCLALTLLTSLGDNEETYKVTDKLDAALRYSDVKQTFFKLVKIQK